jgi:hypothetical protein
MAGSRMNDLPGPGGEGFPNMLANGAKERFKVPGGCKRYYAPEFMASGVSFDIEILQEPVLADIDLHQDPCFTRSLVGHGPLRRPDGQFLPSQFS